MRFGKIEKRPMNPTVSSNRLTGARRRGLRLLALLGVLAGPLSPARADVIADVRAELGSGQLDAARQILATERTQHGVTPELLEAMSWLARNLLNRREYEAALVAAAQTYELAVKAAQQTPLDSERHLPIALGAAIEVQAQAMAARGDRVKAVAQLRAELARYGKTSLVARLQKNLNLLTLEGKPAPALTLERYLGPKPESLSALLGKPVLLFFWAHWCGDCKGTAPIIARLRAEFAGQGLVVMAPTQPYGFTADAQDVTPEVELTYIDSVRHKSYAALLDVPAPVSSANFLTYGASSMPTLVLVNRAGMVVLYHPGRMTYDELKPKIEAALH